ncbi:RNA methyltransferase [Leptobacterium sp. I13]|uniref:TrmH family RNA methyltransferase n=1 Tax=Leptobacterium meishanense TaxID=3128904 RepID=UPI0030EB836D
MDDKKLLTYLEDFITEGRKQKFVDVLSQRTRHFTVAMEDVYQLHNTSAVIRSCDVFGIQDVHIVEARYGKRLDKNIAMGAQQWVDVYRYPSTADCIASLKEKDYQIIATTPHTDFCMLDDFDETERSAFFFGTEKEGLSKEIIKTADGFLKIPMVGFTESLNISVCVAVILHTLTVKLRKSDIDWQLSETEQFEKQLDWTKKSIKSIDQILSRYLDSIN